MIALRPTDVFTQAIGSLSKGPLPYLGATYSRKGIGNRLASPSTGSIEGSDSRILPTKDPKRLIFEQFVLDLSNVSMHFSADMRLSINRQFRSLMSDENWDDDDALPSRGAFATLFRSLSSVKAVSPPSIGTNGNGSITASWFVNSNRLTLDCFDRDRVVFVLSRILPDGHAERAAGETRASTLLSKLSPYAPDVWFR